MVGSLIDGVTRQRYIDLAYRQRLPTITHRAYRPTPAGAGSNDYGWIIALDAQLKDREDAEMATGGRQNNGNTRKKDIEWSNILTSSSLSTLEPYLLQDW
ncbi:hypothetical protein C0J52_11626 [Blattella germanica]|nr:hypothetical protein C0J52_11626 [Blattella germanica]